MSKKTLSWLLIFSLIINISAIATISYYKWFKPKRSTAFTKKTVPRGFFSQKLDLNDEQSKMFRELRSQLWKELKPLKFQLNEVRRDLIILLKQDTVDVKSIEQKIDQISRIQKQMQHKTIENLMQHKSILNKEQRKKFISIMTKRMYMQDLRKEHSLRFKKEKIKPQNNDR